MATNRLVCVIHPPSVRQLRWLFLFIFRTGLLFPPICAGTCMHIRRGNEALSRRAVFLYLSVLRFFSTMFLSWTIRRSLILRVSTRSYVWLMSGEIFAIMSIVCQYFFIVDPPLFSDEKCGKLQKIFYYCMRWFRYFFCGFELYYNFF